MQIRLFNKLKSTAKHQHYTYVRDMEKGSTGPMLVESLGTHSAYVVKGLQYEQEIFSELLEKLAENGRLKVQTFYDEEGELPHSKCINPSYARIYRSTEARDDFYMQKDLFSADFARRFSKACSPKTILFCEPAEDGDNLFIGSKFLPTYKDWGDICIDGKIDGNPIDEDGYVVYPSGKRVPIKDLGLLALISRASIVGDMNINNFGLINCGDYYQAVVVDMNSSFKSFDKFSGFKNAKECLEKAFYKPEYYEDGKFFKCRDACALPPQLINARYIHEELYDGINQLSEMVKPTDTNEGEFRELIDRYFRNFPLLCDLFYEECKQHIEKNIIAATAEAAVEFNAVRAAAAVESYTQGYKAPTTLPRTLSHRVFTSAGEPQRKRQRLDDDECVKRVARTMDLS